MYLSWGRGPGEQGGRARMISTDLKDAIRKWDFEVEQEAIELIEAGVPPYDAIEKARQIISARRREAKRGSR